MPPPRRICRFEPSRSAPLPSVKELHAQRRHRHPHRHPGRHRARGVLERLVERLDSTSASTDRSSVSTSKSSDGFSISTPAGEVSVSLSGDLPPGWPSDFPLPKKTDPAGSGSLGGSSSGTMVGVFSTKESGSDALDFYAGDSSLDPSSKKSAGGSSTFWDRWISEAHTPARSPSARSAEPPTSSPFSTRMVREVRRPPPRAEPTSYEELNRFQTGPRASKVASKAR
jgi:hypothetical protein